LLALASAELGKCLKSKLKNRVLGPEEPLINRIQDFFIMELIIKLERSISLPKAKQVILEEINRVKEYKPFASVITSIDVDPL
jgi:primosomal protein N' (replication factor Y)